MERGIAHDVLTVKFYDYIKLLQRIHMNFKPIRCQFGDNFRNAYVFPCRNLQVQKETCQLMTIRLRYCISDENEPVYCHICSKLAKKKLEDATIRRRTAPDSRVSITDLTDDEKLEKLARLQQERTKLLKRINYSGKVSLAKKRLVQKDLLSVGLEAETNGTSGDDTERTE